MTQVLIDRATLEQMVDALEQHGNAYLGHLTEYKAALEAGRAALANAEPKKLSLTNTATGSLPQRIESIFEAMDKEVAAGRLVRTGPMEWRKL
jgi:DNA-binding MarR family transcriptional regulator